jgi:hypothetical protein
MKFIMKFQIHLDIDVLERVIVSFIGNHVFFTVQNC